MRFTLKDYQADAVGDTLRELASARDFYRSASKRVSSVALASVTGSGKTIMAAAVIEALFWGSDDFDVVPDPNAVVLWFSDDPSLNQQTKHRLQQASDRLRNRLVTVEHPFRHSKLQPGNVYFINTSKLSRNSLLVRGHDSADVLPGMDSIRTRSRSPSGTRCGTRSKTPISRCTWSSTRHTVAWDVGRRRIRRPS